MEIESFTNSSYPVFLDDKTYNLAAEKALEKIIAQAKTHLDASEPPKIVREKNKFYITLMENLDDGMLQSLEKVCKAAAFLTGIAEEDFYDKIDDIKDMLPSAIPSTIHIEKKDNDLCSKLEECIPSIENISSAFDLLKSGIAKELQNLSHEVAFSSFRKPLESYQSIYKELKKTLKTAEKLLSKALKRKNDDYKKYTPSDESFDSFSYVLGPNIDDLKKGVLEFHERTDKLSELYLKADRIRTNMQTPISDFEKHYCYLAYLCAYRCYPNKVNWSHFILWYKYGSYDYLEQNLQFSESDYFIDPKYSREIRLQTDSTHQHEEFSEVIPIQSDELHNETV